MEKAKEKFKEVIESAKEISSYIDKSRLTGDAHFHLSTMTGGSSE
ncbi:MAG: hypothetical protein QME40_07440 [bacterium]|nr:hypothetical protein [bacterium]